MPNAQSSAVLDSTPAGAALSELVQLLRDTSSVEKLLSELAHLAARVVEPPASCGLTMRQPDGHAGTVVSSDALAAQLDEIQYARGVGPCLQALATGEVVRVEDMSEEVRWDGYPAQALAAGVCSSLSLPLIVDGAPLGALNLYSPATGAFDEKESHQAGVFADQAGIALTLVSRQASAAVVNDQLRQALTSRKVIDQAIGVMMGQQRCDADTAFGLLRAASQRSNRKLRDIATEMLDAVSSTAPRPGPPHVAAESPGRTSANGRPAR